MKDVEVTDDCEKRTPHVEQLVVVKEERAEVERDGLVGLSVSALDEGLAEHGRNMRPLNAEETRHDSPSSQLIFNLFYSVPM